MHVGVNTRVMRGKDLAAWQSTQTQTPPPLWRKTQHRLHLVVSKHRLADFVSMFMFVYIATNADFDIGNDAVSDVSHSSWLGIYYQSQSDILKTNLNMSTLIPAYMSQNGEPWFTQSMAEADLDAFSTSHTQRSDVQSENTDNGGATTPVLEDPLAEKPKYMDEAGMLMVPQQDWQLVSSSSLWIW